VKPRTRVTRYTVNALSPTHPKADLFAVHVEEATPGRWAITNRFLHLGPDGQWAIPPYAGRSLPEALALAEHIAPRLVVNGVSVTDAISSPT